MPITLTSPMRNALLALLGLYLALQTARAEVSPEAQGLRLIETAPGKQAWMNEREIGELARISHEAGHCGGFMDVTEYPELPKLFLRPLHPETQYRIGNRESVERLLPELSADSLKNFVQKLAAFPNRYYTSNNGAKAATFIRDTFVGLSSGRSDVKADFFRHSGWSQPSVIVRIQGQGPHQSETVVLGAHMDSINWSFFLPSPDANAPGADDDASGIATLLETFRVLAASGFRPDRSIEFIGYSGEERGLLGSQEISRSYRNAGRVVPGILQLDMTMFPGPNTGITFITDNTNPELTAFGKELTETYVRAPWHETECGYGCSDHASWDKLGYASVFPFETSFGSDNPNIHTDHDLLSYLDIAHGLHFAKFALAFAIEMAGEAH